MPKAILTAPRYILLAGKTEPVYVEASPSSPITVDLPEGTKVSGKKKGIHPVEAPPAPLAAVHPAQKTKVSKKASDAFSKRAADEE
jgi:hypothetical protein